MSAPNYPTGPNTRNAPGPRELVRRPRDLHAEADPATYVNPMDARIFPKLQDEIYKLLEEVELREVVFNEAEEILARDPTWGFYAFIMDYPPDMLEKIPQAMENLIEVTRRNIRAQSTSAYTEEAFRRFKLGVVEDKEALSGASDDRVRAEFRAQLRTLQQLGENDFIRTPARNYACLVLDKPTVFMLADLSFPDNMRDDWPHFHVKAIRIVDAWWKRPATNVSSY
ncbi:hypothetical protein SI65_04631 [Aspergillus cristatus]|uniref:Uncharacterized protein n=1 Tax=Aspergillus cristatus TaxID=573508 RepID=A0A1E3BGY0_ASPCR|nr:hypothetical protein SI65_04631 [Aspergillus cristatus]